LRWKDSLGAAGEENYPSGLMPSQALESVPCGIANDYVAAATNRVLTVVVAKMPTRRRARGWLPEAKLRR
jgi:hypothetical protein